MVAINPTRQEQPLQLTLRNLAGLSTLKAQRTSATENLAEAGTVTIRDGRAIFPMKPLSIVTLAGKRG